MSDVFLSLLRPWTYGHDVLETSYNFEDWEFVVAKLYSPSGNKRKVSAIYNTVTENLYLKDTSGLVAWKCFGIMLGTPFYTVGKIMYHMIKIIIDIVGVIFFHIGQVSHHISNHEGVFGSIIEGVRDAIADSVFLTISHIWQMCRLSYFSIGLGLAALGGVVVDPFQARQQIAIIERKINYAPKQYDVRYGCFKADRVFYLAFCFQPVRNASEKFDNDEPSVKINERFPTYQELKTTHTWVAERADPVICPINRCCVPELV